MIIRQMTIADLPAVIHMGGRMHEESCYGVLDYNPDKVVSFAYSNMPDPDTIALVAEHKGEIVGMFAGFIQEHYFGDGRIAYDHFMYVVPEYRGSSAFVKLLRGYIGWAEEKGADLILLVQSTGINQDKTAALYSRMGFDHVGGVFMKGAREWAEADRSRK